MLKLQSTQHIHPAAGQQRVVQLKRGVLGRRANKNQRAVFHIRQKRILLRLIETVHLIDKQNGFAPPGGPLLFGHLHRRTNILHPRQHGRNGLKARIRLLSEQSRQGGLTHPRRPPQNHGVQMTAFNSVAQRLAGRK